MTMSQMDYVLIAKAIDGERARHSTRANAAGLNALGELVEALVDSLETAYPRFDRRRFYEAVGLEWNITTQYTWKGTGDWCKSIDDQTRLAEEVKL